MESKTLFLSLQHVCQIVLSLYGFFYSFTAIINLQTYEQTTKKAAKWSKEIENQLFKTRMTQGTGIITVSLSLTTALTLLTARHSLPSWAVYASSPAMLLIVLSARAYIKNFWAPETKSTAATAAAAVAGDKEKKDKGTKVPLVPGMQEYNVAVQRTEDLLKVLEYLEYSWLLTGLVTFVLGKKWVE